LRHGIGCIDELDTLLGDVLHSAIDDLGPGGSVAGVIEAIEQACDQLDRGLFGVTRRELNRIIGDRGVDLAERRDDAAAVQLHR
jgi:hypothetical protein